MRNGVMPSQALPSKVSRWRAGGMRDRSASSGIGQCIKSRSCQLIKSAHEPEGDRKSTRLNSSLANTSYAVFCLKKKNPFRLQAGDDDGEKAFGDLVKVDHRG